MTTRSTVPQGALPPEVLAVSRGYMCHERNLYFLYAWRRGVRTFPLLFLDRFLAWSFDEDLEKLTIGDNGLRDLMREYVTEISVSPDEIGEALAAALRENEAVAVEVWMPHTDGALYVTAVLIEHIDDDGIVYYAKFNAVQNCYGRPKPLAKLRDELYVYPSDTPYPYPPGTSLLTAIRSAPGLEAVGRLEPLEAYRQLVALYGYGWSASRLTRHGTPVRIDSSAVDQLIDRLVAAPEDVITPEGLPKTQQFRLSLDIIYLFEPVQQCLTFLRADSRVCDLLGAELVREVDEGHAAMAAALQNIVKSTSLLSVRPTTESLEYYLVRLRRLRDLLPGYQRMNLAVMRGLATPSDAYQEKDRTR